MLTAILQISACIAGATLVFLGFHLSWEAGLGIGLLTYAAMPQVR